MGREKKCEAEELERLKVKNLCTKNLNAKNAKILNAEILNGSANLQSLTTENANFQTVNSQTVNTQNLNAEKNTLHGNMNLVFAFSIVALLVLGIACINFVNLTVAKTSTREKEIYLPIFFTISIGLLVQQNLYKTVNKFNLEDFASGKLNSKGYI